MYSCLTRPTGRCRTLSVLNRPHQLVALERFIEDRFERLLDNLKIHLHEGFKQIMAALDNLTAAVAAETTIDQSAATLLAGLKAALDEAIAKQPTDNGAALQALTDQLGTAQGGLQAAITASTPAAPPA